MQKVIAYITQQKTERKKKCWKKLLIRNTRRLEDTFKERLTLHFLNRSIVAFFGGMLKGSSPLQRCAKPPCSSSPSRPRSAVHVKDDGPWLSLDEGFIASVSQERWRRPSERRSSQTLNRQCKKKTETGMWMQWKCPKPAFGIPQRSFIAVNWIRCEKLEAKRKHCRTFCLSYLLCFGEKLRGPLREFSRILPG